VNAWQRENVNVKFGMRFNWATNNNNNSNLLASSINVFVRYICFELHRDVGYCMQACGSIAIGWARIRQQSNDNHKKITTSKLVPSGLVNKAASVTNCNKKCHKNHTNEGMSRIKLHNFFR